MDTRRYHDLKPAKKAIAKGDVQALSKALNNLSDTCSAETQLLLHAAATNQDTILDYLINSRGFKVTPNIMKEYFVILEKHRRNENNFIKDHYPHLRDLKPSMGISGSLDITLMMFKAFLENRLFEKNVSEKAIKNIFNKVKDYLPEHTQQYRDFMQEGKAMILMYGSIALIKSLDETLHYLQDRNLLETITEDLRKNKKYKYFDHRIELIETLMSPTSDQIDTVNNKYAMLLPSVLAKLDKLDAKKHSVWSHSHRADDIRVLKKTIQKINQDEPSSVVKIWKAANLIAKIYNEVCQHSEKSSTAKRLWEMLQDLSQTDQNFSFIFAETKHKLKPVVLLQTEEMAADELIARKDSTPELSPNTRPKNA